jgi:hypothetical protein
VIETTDVSLVRCLPVGEQADTYVIGIAARAESSNGRGRATTASPFRASSGKAVDSSDRCRLPWSPSWRGSGPWRFTMELVDRLLTILAGPNPRLASQRLMAAGHTEDEVRGEGLPWLHTRSRSHHIGLRDTVACLRLMGDPTNIWPRGLESKNGRSATRIHRSRTL